MARTPYSRDYRLIESVDERGRIRTDTEYIGAYYRFVSPGQAAAALKRAGLYGKLAALCFILSLLPRSTASLTLYVTLPYLFTAIPLALLLGGLYRLRQSGQRLDRKAADAANDRYPARCLALFVLPLLALAGEGIALGRGGAFLAGDALFLLGALGCGLLGWLCFSLRGGLRAVEEGGD